MSSISVRTRSRTSIVASRIRRQLSITTKNPQWMAMDLLSRFVTVRRTAALLRKPVELNRIDTRRTLLEPVDLDAAVSMLRKDGYCSGLRLTEPTRQIFTNYGLTAVCHGNGVPANGMVYDKKAQVEQARGTTFTSANFPRLPEHLPQIRALARDGQLLSLAARYFGSKPMFTGCRMWWTFATPEDKFDVADAAAFFHYDKDDYACLRVFFYLTDVDSASGPHHLIRASHTDKPLSQLFSLGQRSDQQLLEHYGIDKVKSIVGPAGSGFAEDPFTFHRATRPRARDRLVLQLSFATRYYGMFSDPA